MNNEKFNQIITEYELDASEVYRDLSEFGLMLHLDKAMQFSMSIEAHVSSEFAVFILNTITHGKYVSYSEPLENIDSKALQLLIKQVKGGHFELGELNANKIKVSIFGGDHKEVYSAILQ